MSQIHDTLMGADANDRRRWGPYEPLRSIETGMESAVDLRLLQELERLQGALDMTFKPGQRRAIAFTGAVPGEGVTALSLHYALFVARTAEQDVLLVDFDLSHGGGGLSEGLGDVPGVAQLLGGEASAGEAVIGTEEQHLQFLPSGRSTTRHTELVHSPRLQGLIDDLGRRYHTVIIDTPPVVSNPETTVIGSQADGVVFVVHARRTRREVIQRAVKTLQMGGARVLGSVLNRRVHDIPRFIYHRV